MRRNYGGYTRRITQKFQSYFDIATSNESATVLQFNAGGNDIIQRMPWAFSGFKYFRLRSLSVVGVPASTLPVDPSGLSYEAGENQVDPRDQLTPGLIRITNGEDLGSFSANFSRQEYDAMMLDPRWYKFMLQKGFKRFCKPRFWGVGMLRQDQWPGSIVNSSVNDGSEFVGTAHDVSWIRESTDVEPPEYSSVNAAFFGSNDRGLFQTGERVPMGWLPTDVHQNASGLDGEIDKVQDVPECQCVTVILPQQFKTKYYYRVFVTETVEFKDPVVYTSIAGDVPIITGGIDRHIAPTIELGNRGHLGTDLSPGNDGDRGGVNRWQSFTLCSLRIVSLIGLKW